MAGIGFGIGGFASGLGNGYRLGQTIRNNNMTYQLNALKLRQQEAAFGRQQALLQDSQAASDDTRKAIASGDVALKDAGTYWAMKHAPQLALDYMQNGDFDSANKLMTFAQNSQHQDIMNKQATLAGAIHWAKNSGNYAPVDKAMANLYNSLPTQLTGGVQYQGSKVNDDGSINVTFADPKSGKQFQQNYRDLDTLQTSVEPYLQPQVYYQHLQNAGLVGALEGKGGQAPAQTAAAPSADLLSPQPTADASPNLGGNAAATAKAAANVDPGAAASGAAPADQTASANPTGGDATPDASPVAAEGSATPQASALQAPALPQIKMPIGAPQMTGAAPVVPAASFAPMPVQADASGAVNPVAPAQVADATGAAATPDASAAPATFDQRFAAADPSQTGQPASDASAAVPAVPAAQPVGGQVSPAAMPRPPATPDASAPPPIPAAPAATAPAVAPDAAQPNIATVPVQQVDPSKAAAFGGGQPAPAAPAQSNTNSMFAAIPQGLRDYAVTLLRSNDPAQVKAGQTLVTSMMNEYGKPQTVAPGATVFAFGKPVYTNDAGSLTNQAAALLAARLRMGDNSAIASMGRGAIGSLNQAKVINAMAAQGATAQEMMQARQKFEAAQKAQKDFATGQQGNAVKSFNVAVDHLDLLRNLAQAMGNDDMRTVNSLRNMFRTEFGSDLPTNVEAAKQIVSAEINKAVTASGGALGDREELQKPIDPANSWGQISGVIDKVYLPLMAGQLGGLKRQYEFSTHQNDFEQMLSPRTQQYLQQRQQTQAQASFSPPSNWQYSPSRQMYRDPQGNLYDKSGQPVRAQ